MELTIPVENLYAVVLPVADEHRAVVVHQKTVGQVKMSGLSLAGLTPRLFQLAVRGEAVHPGVPIAVGDVEVSRRGGNHLAGIIEGTGRPGAQIAGILATRVGVDAVPAQHLDGLAIQRVHDAHGGVPVGDVDDIVGDVDTVGKLKRAVPPRIQQIAIPVEDHYRRVFPLEGVNPVLGIGSHGANRLESLAFGQLCPVHDRFIGIFAGSYGSHFMSTPFGDLRGNITMGPGDCLLGLTSERRSGGD